MKSEIYEILSPREILVTFFQNLIILYRDDFFYLYVNIFQFNGQNIFVGFLLMSAIVISRLQISCFHHNNRESNWMEMRFYIVYL